MSGITDRDHFAAAALTGLLAQGDGSHALGSWDVGYWVRCGPAVGFSGWGQPRMIAFVLLAAAFASEPRGQEYALAHGDPVLFWIPDEQPPRYGTCYYLWGYVPTISCDGKSHRFADVEWCRGSL